MGIAETMVCRTVMFAWSFSSTNSTSVLLGVTFGDRRRGGGRAGSCRADVWWSCKFSFLCIAPVPKQGPDNVIWALFWNTAHVGILEACE